MISINFAEAQLNSIVQNGYVNFLENNTQTSIFTRGKQQTLNQISQRRSAWQELNIRTLALKQAAEALIEQSNYIFSKIRSNSASITATITGSAQTGTHSVTVSQLAGQHKIASDQQTSTSAALGLSGTIEINNTEIEINASDSLQTIEKAINAAQQFQVSSNKQAPAFTSTGGTIEINDRAITIAAGSTLLSIRDAINSEELLGAIAAVKDDTLYLAATNGNTSVKVEDTSGTVFNEIGVLDSVNQVGTESPSPVAAQIEGARLLIENTSGTNKIQLTDNNTILQTIGVLNSLEEIKNEVTAAQQAVFTVDGVHYTKDSNVISDVIAGAELTLTNTTSYAATLRIEDTTDSVKSLILDFVDEYNNAIKYLNEQLSFEGAFQGRKDVLDIRDTLIENIKNDISGLKASLNALQDIGIKQNIQIINNFTTSTQLPADENAQAFNSELAENAAIAENQLLNQLGKLGISFEGEGTLAVDLQVLEQVLNAEPLEVKKLFTEQSDTIAQRISRNTGDITNENIGIIVNQLKLLEKIEENVEKEGVPETELQKVIEDTNNNLGKLLSLQQLLSQQKQFLEGVIGFNSNNQNTII